MAALIARATSAGPGTPTNGTLTPPACLAGGTWDCEDWGNGFSDRNGLDANLWRNVGALQHYGVAFGYDGAACAARGVASPCYAPNAAVSYIETVVFITRAMIAKGYWVAQPGANQPYPGVPAVFAATVATYHYYTGGIPAPPSNWNAGATRGWFARALWQALNTYWATDGTLPDGRGRTVMHQGSGDPARWRHAVIGHAKNPSPHVSPEQPLVKKRRATVRETVAPIGRGKGGVRGGFTLSTTPFVPFRVPLPPVVSRTL